METYLRRDRSLNLVWQNSPFKARVLTKMSVWTFIETAHLTSLIALVILCAPTNVMAEEASNVLKCSNNRNFEGKPGYELTLTSDVSRGERCYFIYTDRNGGDQCCYNLKDSHKDCDTSTKYKSQDKTNCLKENSTFEMKLDSRGSGTCNITIIGLSQAASGHWKSYNADHKPTDEDEQGCSVIVAGEEQLSVTVIVLIVLAVVVCVIILAIVLLCHLKVITCKELKLKIDYQALSTKTSGVPNP